MRPRSALLRGIALACALAPSAAAQTPAATGAPSKAACGSAYVEGQRLLRAGSLKAARQQLLICARDPCPAALQPECVGWLDDAQKRIPTIVIEAHLADGSDVTDVKVTIDGALLLPRLDGRASEVDPGQHALRFEHAGTAPVEMTIVTVEGDKDRRVRVTLGTGPTTATASATTAPVSPAVSGDEPGNPESTRPIGWPIWLLGGIAVVAAGSFTYFGLAGLSQHQTLDACKGSCSSSDVDADRTKLIVADVSLGVGIVSLAAATYLFLTRPTRPSSGITRPAVQVDGFWSPHAAGASITAPF